MMKKQNNRLSSELFYHTTDENLNCTQAILKGFQKEFDIDNQEIEEFRAWGGGRAEGGVCGALFSAERLLRQAGKESIVEDFRNHCGGTLCSAIKDKQFTCAEYVRIADELVEKNIVKTI
jgi:Putative redox-active protein (C_GCAxxG_C_C)